MFQGCAVAEQCGVQKKTIKGPEMDGREGILAGGAFVWATEKKIWWG